MEQFIVLLGWFAVVCFLSLARPVKRGVERNVTVGHGVRVDPIR